MNILRHHLTAALITLGGVSAAFAIGVVAMLPELSVPTAQPQIVLEPAALKARSAVVYDAQSGEVLYQKNAYEPRPLASLTKLMAATVVLADQSTEASVLITRQDLAQEGDSHLRSGSEVTIGDLLKYGLVASSNDAIAAAASSLGDPITRMNAKARELGLTKTYFRNPTGLDESAKTPGGVGNAYDVARLASAFLRAYPAYFELTAAAASIHAGSDILEAQATAAPLADIPGFIGAKTGYTDLAGGNLVAAFDLEIGRPIVIAVLGSTREGRFADVRALIEAARRSHTTP